MKRVLSLLCATTLFITGCPGEPLNQPLNVFEIQGDVFVPQGDTTLVASNPLGNFDPLNYLMPPASAATGLTKAAAGVEVRLIRINDSGRSITNEPLAKAVTDKDGHYILQVPADKVALPATDLVIEVGNYASGNYLRNFAIGDKLDLTPITTATVQYLVDRQEPLVSIPPSVIQETYGLADEGTQSLDFSNITLSTSVNNTLSSLKANAKLQTRLDQLLTRVVSGRVLGPNGRVAAVPERFRLDSWLMPSAEALIGLQAVSANVTVSLNKVDDNGNMGPALATTKTRSDGSYTMILPTEAFIDTGFMVSVGSGPSLMRAFLSGSSQLDVSPLSEATTRLILNNGTILNQPRVPISEFPPPEVNSILSAVQNATDSTTLGGASSVSSVMALIDPIVRTNSSVLGILRSFAGVPAPVVNSVIPATAKDVIDVLGTASPGSLISIEGGTSVVQQQLSGSETNFKITVPLKRNSSHALKITAFTSGKVSLPAIVNIRQDNLNPVIQTNLITALKPRDNSFETIVTGKTGAIKDSGRATVVISGPKLGNSTQVQTDNVGAFTANLAADSGDTLTLRVTDEAKNVSEATIVVGGPGPVITDVVQQSTIQRDSPFANRVITVNGAGFDNQTLTDNIVTFIKDGAEFTNRPRSVSIDGRSMVVPVPEGMVDKLNQLPRDVFVRSTTDSIDSNDNRSFTLFPAVAALIQSRLDGNGESEFFHFDGVNLFMTSQRGSDAHILVLDTNGNILRRNIAFNVAHDSIFRDLTVDSSDNLLISNFDVRLAGKDLSSPQVRPNYRISKYDTLGTGAEMELADRLAEVALPARPGAIALSNANNKLYVALPSEGQILKIDYTGGIFGRPEVLLAGLPTPIKDIQLVEDGKFMYITLGNNLSMFRLTLNSRGDVDLTDSNFAGAMGNGNGRMTVDQDGHVYVTVGTGIERINQKGERVNLIPILDGQDPTVGLIHVNNKLFVNQLRQPDLFKITP